VTVVLIREFFSMAHRDRREITRILMTRHQ
jgi:hypothetical protein